MSSDHVCTCPSIDRQTLCQRSCSEREFGTCHFANIYNHHAMENGYQVNIIVQTKSLQQQQQQKAAAVRSLISTQEMSSFSSSTPLSLAYNHTHTLRERETSSMIIVCLVTQLHQIVFNWCKSLFFCGCCCTHKSKSWSVIYVCAILNNVQPHRR